MSDSANTTTTRRRNSSRIAQQASKVSTSKSSTSNTNSKTAANAVNTSAKEVIDAEQIQKLTEKYQNELHQQRLEYLKKQLHLARRENWRYPSFDSIFSGHFHN